MSGFMHMLLIKIVSLKKTLITN